MAVASLCDATGIVELTLVETAAERYGDLLAMQQAVIVQGRVSIDVERGVGIEVIQVEVLN